MRELKISTAANVMVFMTDSTDHVTGKASLTLTITASKDGAAFASITPTVTDRGSGWYNLALTTSHTDTLGDLAIHITSTGADPSDLSCRIIAIDKADAVRSGLTALPNAAAEAAGGLYTRGTGAGQINQANNGQVDANAVRLGGTTQTGRDIGASVLLSSGTGTGELSFTSGILKVDLETIKTQAITCAAGVTVLASVGTAATNTAQTGDSFARIGATGSSLTSLSTQASVDAIQSDTNDIQARLPAALISGRIDANTTVLSTRAGATIVLGTVNASPSPTTTSLGAAVDVVPTDVNQFLGRVLIFARDTTTTGLRGQATNITASTAPGSGNTVLTFTALTTAPADTDSFVIV